MSARDFLRLLADSPTIVRTLRQTYGSPEPDEQLRHAAAQVQRLVRSVHPALVQTRVAQIIRETPDARTLVLEAVEGDLPPHWPGQYVNVFVDIAGVRTSRPMSISSAPGEARMQLTIKRKAGGFVSAHLLDNVQQGDTLTISGPEGDFGYLPFRDGQDLVFIAGGSGITPLMGMMAHALQRDPDLRIHLLYGSTSPEQIIFRSRIEALAARYGRLDVTLSVDRPADGWSGQQGFIDGRMIRAALGPGGVQGKTFFVCGPPDLEQAVREALESMDVPRSRVRVELVGAAGDPTLQPDWPEGLEPGDELVLRVTGSESEVVAVAGESLLNSLERAGFAVPALCRSGACGSCRTRLVEGAVVFPREAGQRPSDEQAGYVNACVCYPVSDAVVQLPGPGLQRAGEREQELARAVDHGPVALTIQPRRERSGVQGSLWVRGALALGGLGLLVLLVVVAGIRWLP